MGDSEKGHDCVWLLCKNCGLSTEQIGKAGYTEFHSVAKISGIKNGPMLRPKNPTAPVECTTLE